MAAETRHWRQKVYLIPLLGLMLLPLAAGLVETSVWHEISPQKRYALWEQPWYWLAAAFTLSMLMVPLRLPKWARVDILLVLALMVLSFVLAKTAAPIPALALQQLLLLMLAVGAGMAAYVHTTQWQRGFSDRLYVALLVGGVIHIPLVLAVFLIFRDTPDVLWSSRIPGVGGIRRYNYLVEAGVMVAAGVFVTRHEAGKLLRVALWLVAAAFWMMLFWSSGRGALLAIFGALTVATMVFPAYGKALWAVVLSSMLAGAMASLLIYTPDGGSFGLIAMLEKLMGREASGIGSGRLQMWLQAVEIIKDRPLLGHGLQQFLPLRAAYIPAELNYHLHVHNVVLEVLMSWGTVGASLFLALALRTGGKILVRVRASDAPERFPAFLALVSLLGHALLSGSYHHPYSVVLMGVLAGICLAPKPAQNENTTA